MKGVSRVKLSEILQVVSKPKYILGTTYSLSLAFFESVVFGSTFRDRSRLKSCLIVCDVLGYQRALSEGAALQGAGQDYIVAPAPLADCFHPKTWLVLGESEAVLLCGSGNLTQAGFMANAELFDAVHMTCDKPATPNFLRSIERFVEGLAQMWSKEDSQNLLCVETLADISQALAGIPVGAADETAPQFLHSFTARLIEQMPNVGQARELFVAAPYFGNSLAGLNLLNERYSGSELRVFPAVHGENATDIPLAQFSRSYKAAKISRLSVAPKGKGSFAHLKLYGIAEDKDTAWLYCTSANATEAAWTGRNIEAGILRSVPRSRLANYFVADKLALPEGNIEYQSIQEVNNHTLRIWASETGTRLEISVAVSNAEDLPLKDVTLTVRAGSSLVSCCRPVLFADGHMSSIDWNLFPEWQRRRKTALCLEIRGSSINGSLVKATCFVENRMLLTADPLHRSAWRGALSLLSDEGAPELADIGAIFSLVRDLFEGTLLRVPATTITTTAGEQKNAKDSIAPPVAIWPPEPDLRELQKKIGKTAAGHLHWFQRILQTLLRNERSEVSASGLSNVVTTDAGEDAGESVRDTTEEDKRNRTLAERLWLKANKDYEYLRDRLFELMPTPENAASIWPAAVFAFLSTMAVFRAVTRLAPGTPFGTDSGTLCDEFFRTMLNRRKQHENFCCPKHYRYRSEVFPELADDLRKEFGVELDPDLTDVIMVLITDKQLRSPSDRSLKRRVGQVCASGFAADQKNLDASARVWRRYIRDAASTSTDDDFTRAFWSLVNSTKPSDI
jgi:hypothetical protein